MRLGFVVETLRHLEACSLQLDHTNRFGFNSAIATLLKIQLNERNRSYESYKRTVPRPLQLHPLRKSRLIHR